MKIIKIWVKISHILGKLADFWNFFKNRPVSLVWTSSRYFWTLNSYLASVFENYQKFKSKSAIFRKKLADFLKILKNRSLSLVRSTRKYFCTLNSNTTSNLENYQNFRSNQPYFRKTGWFLDNFWEQTCKLSKTHY